MTYRQVTDKPRYPQLSTVGGLTLIPFGFNVGVDGALNVADNANPPQVFAEAGANNQEYILRCPKGNPAKVWAVCYADDGIEAAISDFSTIGTGELTIDLDAEPTGDMRIKGFLAYGKNFGEGKGAVAAANDPPEQIKSFGAREAKSLVKQLMILSVGWTVDGSNLVTETRGPLGAVVEPQGSGVYQIKFDHATPRYYPDNWATLFGASDGRKVAFSTATDGARTTVIVTFTDDTNMTNGERADILLRGPASVYPRIYGGASGGVHSEFAGRDIHTYATYKTEVGLRESRFYPIHATIAASTAGPTEATSNLPPGFRITRTGAGVYQLYIGKFPADQVTCGFQLDDGTAVGVTAVDGPAGTLTLTAVGGDPGATVLCGWIVVGTQKVK
jgi:hypothetical protein